jgi:hypothetical protein
MKLLRIRGLQQATVLLGAIGGFAINVVLFGFLMDVFGDTSSSVSGNLRNLFIIGNARFLLSFTGVGILIFGTTKSTELLVRLRDCDHVDELQAVKSVSWWYVIAGFGLGMTAYYLTMLN